MGQAEAKPRPTLWWYALCLLGGPIVAALGYIAVRGEDPEMADELVMAGVVSSIDYIMVGPIIILRIPMLLWY